ncbi:hypothetical protein L1987_32812 [Smallanthus sonchifolius]|uniref:Uncharacterized protein n=1 Tax=Smallanthus sonchifolius TaxID=185202 RepID=A0ACB9HP97_9ASTR|nr:hypothetical protein L1987_32812 [Smallanthus sonchifolius]
MMVIDWNIPKTPTEIRIFLGLASYCRRFIQDFLKIASLLTKLTQKEVKYDWGSTQDEAFKELKEKLTQAPVLALPEGNEHLVLYSDASVKAFQLVVTPDVMREIEKAQDEALEEENIKKDRMVGQHDK